MYYISDNKWIFDVKISEVRMKKILQLPGSIERRNGRMSVIMNIYRKVDRSKIQFDFACTDYGFDNYLEEIQKLGGKVFWWIILQGSLRKLVYQKIVHR